MTQTPFPQPPQVKVNNTTEDNINEEKEVAEIRKLMKETLENPLVLWRKRHGISRKQLAIASGLSYKTLCDLEAGYISRPSVRTVSALQQVGVPPDISFAFYLRWRNQLKRSLKDKLEG